MTKGTPFEVPKEVFDRAKAQARNKNGKYFYMTGEDERKYFSDAERIGYGLYGCMVCEEDGKYMCHYSLGSSCD